MPDSRVVLASSNVGKLRELAALLSEVGVQLLPQDALGVKSVEETGASFVENALLKARHASLATGLPALADDSGLAVAALHGAPGIRSARYAGASASDADNVALLLQDLAEVAEEQRAAAFHCAIVLVAHDADPVPLIAEGEWRGSVLRSPQGDGGFGYDPVFLVPDLHMSAAELPAATKNRLSHRAKAVRRLLLRLRSRPRT